jgi:hypothetical protein
VVAISKQSGLGDDFYWAGYRIGGDIQDVMVHGGPAPLDVTDITQSGHARLGGLRDGGIQLTTFMDPSAGQEHAAFSSLPAADEIGTYLRGQAIGNPAACCVAKQLNYDPTRASDGMLTFKVEGQGDGYGLEWGIQLTNGLRTDTAATNGTSRDFTAASPSFGAQAYLQAVSFTGTDVTVKLQDSADNATFADVTGGAFTQITGGTPKAQRIATSASLQIRRYVRVSTVTTGGFSSLAFQVTVVVNQTATVF